jgi:hypothetical protein|tara:strand:- start:871 stop:1341 length:471 start_codon:yes stop_codon:yes gene_type:complete
MSYTLEDIYNDYCNTNENIDKTIFKAICSDFNIKTVEDILEGGTFNMGNNLSTLSIRRTERDPRSPRIDWGESNKYKKELLENGKTLYSKHTEKGVKWYIYYTDKFYCRYYWNKGKCRIPNKSAYRFTPTRGLKGNKEKLINLLKTDDLAYLKFKK